MNANEILGMTLDEAVENGMDIYYEFKPAEPYETFVEIGPVGAYFDKEYGNYLPKEPPQARVEVSDAALITLSCNGVPFASGTWHLPKSYYVENIVCEDDGTAYIDNIDGIIRNHVEDMMASTDDPGEVLTEILSDPDLVLDYFGGEATIGSVISSSSLFSAI